MNKHDETRAVNSIHHSPPLPKDQAQTLDEHLSRTLPFLGGLNMRLNSPLSAVDLQDVAQEAGLSLWQNLHRIVDPNSLGAYARGIARRAYFTALRKRSRQREVLVEDALPDEESSICFTAPRDDLSRAVAELDARERDIVSLHIWKDQSFRTIAASLSSAEGTVKSIYYRSLDKLRLRLA